jgi:hypothetical protein
MILFSARQPVPRVQPNHIKRIPNHKTMRLPVRLRHNSKLPSLREKMTKSNLRALCDSVSSASARPIGDRKLAT